MAKIKYPTEQLREAVKESTNWNEVCRKVGASASPGMSTMLKNRAAREGINFDHFPKNQWRPTSADAVATE